MTTDETFLIDQLTKSAQNCEISLRQIFDQQQGKIPEQLLDAMRYAALGGGKRVRPLLVNACCGLFDVDQHSASRIGAALECVHCYSLVHDDLPAMDDDDLRRGRPTVHVKYDEATAILVGDGLLSLAFEILSHSDTHPDSQIRSDLVLKLAEASGPAGMVGGQVLDIAAEKDTAVNLEFIEAIQSKKTGALLTFACESAAIAGNVDPVHRAALINYGQAIGKAFQIADDLLDLHSTAEVMGKAVQKDKDAGKMTFISALGETGARDALISLVERAHNSVEVFGEKALLLKQIATYIAERKN